MGGQRDWLRVSKAVVAVARERQISITAAGLAFYAFNSFIPIALLLVIGISAVEGLGAAASALEFVSGVDADQVEVTLQEVTEDGQGRRRAGVIAAGIFLYSTATMFQAVNMAFSEVYGTRKHRSGLQKVTDTGLIFATVLLAVLLMGVVGVALAFVVDGVAWTVLSPPLLFVALFAAFVPMYYRFPGERVTLREAVPGAALSALAWTISALFFRFYAATSESVALYGVAGAALLLLTWLYLGGLTLLVGAVVNATLAGRVDADYEWLPTTE